MLIPNVSGKEGETLNIRLSGEVAETVAARCAWEPRGDEEEKVKLTGWAPLSQTDNHQKRAKGEKKWIEFSVNMWILEDLVI